MYEDDLKNICPECGCGSLVFDEGAGEVVCSKCGLVVEGTMVDEGPERPVFDFEDAEERSRTGPPLSFSKQDKGLSSEIGTGRASFFDKKGIVDRYEMLRLRKLNIRVTRQTSVQRNLSFGMRELDRLCDNLKISPDLQESAAVIYRKALKEDLVRGRSIASIAAASLHLALRRANVPRTLKEICDASTRSRKEISRCYRLLLWKLGYMTPIDDPVYYVSKIATTVGLSQRVQMKAIELLREGRQRHVTVGKDPSGMAAASLYIACVELGEKVTQKKLAEAGGITEVTVRNRYKGLIKDMKLNIVKAKTR
jgi:transcription initiation factor TFIIB